MLKLTLDQHIEDLSRRARALVLKIKFYALKKIFQCKKDKQNKVI